MFNSQCEKLLGVSLDSNLIFGSHINNICKKTGLQLNALVSTTPYLDLTRNNMRFSFNNLTFAG